MPDRLRPLWDFDDLDGTDVALPRAARRGRVRRRPCRGPVATRARRRHAGRVRALRGVPRRGRAARGRRSRCARPASTSSAAASSVRVATARGGIPAVRVGVRSRLRGRRVLVRRRRGAHVRDRRHRREHDGGVDAARSRRSASREPDAAYWAGPLLNNLGWAYFETGDHQHALEVFEQALDVRERDPGNPAAIVWAKEAIDEARQGAGALARRRLETLGAVVRAASPTGRANGRRCGADGRASNGSSIVVTRTLARSVSGQPPPKRFAPAREQNVFALPPGGS